MTLPKAELVRLGAAVVVGALLGALSVAVLRGPGEEAADPVASTTTEPPPEVVATGFPDAATTGVPDGVELVRLDDDDRLVVTEDLDGVELHGMVLIGAPGVRITRSRIVVGAAPLGIWNRDRHPDVVVDQVDIVCEDDGEPGAAGVADVAVVRRSDISGCADGIKIGAGAVVEGNYIHDLGIGPGVHNDGIQMQGGGGVVIRGNTIVMVDPGTRTANAGVFVQSTSAPVDTVAIVGNMVDGFGFSLRFDGDVTDSIIVDNVIGDQHLWGPTLFSGGAEDPARRNVSRANTRPDGSPID